jgi:hypothetical protein
MHPHPFLRVTRGIADIGDLGVAYSDGSGTITFDEFKSVFSAEIGPDAIPFNFDWYVAFGRGGALVRCVELTHLVTGSSST